MSISSEYQLLKQSKSMFENKLKYGFEVINCQYLIFYCECDIYYFDMSIKSTNNKMIKLNLNLRKGKITQVLETKQEHYVQFVYKQKKAENSATTNFVFIWDLKSNQEMSSVILPSQTNQTQVKIYKGIDE